MVLIKNETVGRPWERSRDSCAQCTFSDSFCINGKRFRYQLKIGKTFLLTLSHWVMTKVFGQNIAKKFSDLKFVSEKLPFHLQYA